MTITSVSSACYKVWAYGNIGYVPRSKVNIVSGTLGGKAPKHEHFDQRPGQGQRKMLRLFVRHHVFAQTRHVKKGARICVLSVKNFYRVLYKGEDRERRFETPEDTHARVLFRRRRGEVQMLRLQIQDHDQREKAHAAYGQVREHPGRIRQFLQGHRQRGQRVYPVKFIKVL